ncbi:adenosylcobalamin-dependent ribonucleoside-diphosphate reductase [Rhodomicrobium sp. Az07]|uniref:adenosylcobalamin-dependent ribonucleoside-diphosphate reductase n=1 Tax=Rhodomicrobium sp. Az07 TaxID=2839034 RepID=UPI001BECB50D|nr:adenosylcobalamin-dependent ribonucleoside-diphosphate reductase [Rhodomicrobium sp. Az07]MBT3070005.1 adenosylcobalamin-dependent ribonucleoside-diphosphate reductase [Rhodomicrobium sp. Az07]
MLTPISRQIWEAKYRFTPTGAAPERSVKDTFARVAKAAASAEHEASRKDWEKRFLDAMADFAFIPAGRILAGAGTGRDVTLFNCFVMGEIGDDMGSIFANVREAALTLQQGGGIGHDFSTLRPKGAPVKGVGADASGPVSFMDVWDAMCRTIMSAGSRRGAMMGTLRCDHPDIEAFIEAKADPARLRNFNLSVLVTDAFMEAVKADARWPLIFEGTVFREVSARGLWLKIMRSAYDYAEPGVIFIDRVNAANNLAWCETISATNPCGEQPLPPYGACLLGSINLAALIENPFEPQARLDEARLETLVPVAVRLLDNIIDVSRYPLPSQEREAKAKRRIGLGVTGLADALIFCGAHYGEESGRALAASWMARISQLAYEASAALAREKGAAFPLFEADAFLARPFPASLPSSLQQAIRQHGIRNGVLTSIAPTGTISLLASNVSSGVEPVFDFEFSRRVLQPDGSTRHETVEDYAVRIFREKRGDAPLPPAFVAAHQLTPAQHLEMQAALQRHVDASISKTVNCPASIPFEDFEMLYADAYRLGLKGCTAYRPNAVTGEVLTPASSEEQPPAQPALPLTAAVAREAHAVEPIPRVREPVLSGFTYKLKWPGSDHAIYVTINDSIEDGERRPFEIFINSKNLEHYAWTVALTRMISAIFRRGGDIGFVVEELKAVFDPRGGAWMEGRYVPSLLAAIGDIVERHFIHIGFQGEASEHAPRRVHSRVGGEGEQVGRVSLANYCPRCGAPGMVSQEGCRSCRVCGFSTCN